MEATKAVVLDSWAIMAFLEAEPAAAEVRTLIHLSQGDGTRLLMSVINAGEIWYSLARRRSVKNADETIQWLHEIGIKFIDADWTLTKIAAGYKVKGNISYADCHAAAVAKHHKASLLTGDHEFEQLSDEISIVWL